VGRRPEDADPPVGTAVGLQAFETRAAVVEGVGRRVEVERSDRLDPRRAEDTPEVRLTTM